jgi:hypothetical protein
MLCYKLQTILKREPAARSALRHFEHLGGAIHRIGDTREFVLIVPLRKPERRAALLKQLDRNSVGAVWKLIDMTGFDRDGPVYRYLSESEADALIRTPEFIRDCTRTVIEKETADDWLEAS